MHGCSRWATATLGALVAAAALHAAPASAGEIAASASTELPTSSCTGSCPDDYALSLPGAGAPLEIRPLDGRPRTNGEAAAVDLPAPDYDHLGAVQGYVVRVDVTGSSFGQNWQPVLCTQGPGAGPRDAQPICDGGEDLLDPASPSVLTAAVPQPERPTRLALRYIGRTGTPDASTIALRAKASWSEIDTQAPTLSPTIGGRPWAGGGGVFGAGGGDAGTGVPLDAGEVKDNTEASSSLSYDGGLRGTDEIQVPDGSHQVSATACDIAVPPNCTTVSGRITVDSQPPQATIASVASRASRPPVAVTATDPQVNGFSTGLVPGGKLKLGDALIDADASLTGDQLVLTPKQPVAEGSYPLTAVVSDRAFNLVEAQPRGDTDATLVVDHTPPVTAPRTPASNARLATSPPVISASVADAVGLRSARLLLDGLQLEGELSTDDQGAPTVDASPAGRLCAGPHTVTAIADDLVGLTATATWRFRVAGKLTRSCAARICRAGQRAVSRSTRTARRELGIVQRATRRAHRGTAADRHRWAAVARTHRDRRRVALRTARTQRRAIRTPCRVARKRS